MPKPCPVYLIKLLRTHTLLYREGPYLNLGLFKLLHSLHGRVSALQARMQHVHLLDERVVARPVLLQAAFKLSTQRARIHKCTVVAVPAETILALVLCWSLHPISPERSDSLLSISSLSHTLPK